MFYSSTIRWSLIGCLILLTIVALYFAISRPADFDTVFAREDGIVEYSTAIFLFCAGAALAALAGRCIEYRRWLLVLYALVFVVAAGEEISWGQRIFGFVSNDFFLENNRQGEINFHNLFVGEEQLVNFWLGPVLTLAVLIYLVVIPLLHPVSGVLRGIVDLFAVPVAQRWVTLVAVAWSVIVVWIDLPRNWEAYECTFSILICITFFAPANRTTFRF